MVRLLDTHLLAVPDTKSMLLSGFLLPTNFEPKIKYLFYIFNFQYTMSNDEHFLVHVVFYF